MTLTTIVINDTKEEITIEGEVYLLCKKNDLEGLLNRLGEYKGDISIMKDAIIDILRLMGFWDDKKNSFIEGMDTGQVNHFKLILKSLKTVIFLLAQAQIGSRSAEEELKKKFAFIKTVLPLAAKYAKR